MCAVHHMQDASVEPDGAGRIQVQGDAVLIESLLVDDPALIQLVASAPPLERAEAVRRALSVGVRGLASMGVGIDVAAVDERVRATVAAVTADAERRIEALIEAGRRAFSEHFDPEQRSSIIARALSEFGQWRDSLGDLLDPGAAGSHTTTFLERLTELVGPGGALEARLTAALDPESDSSSLGRFGTSMKADLEELKALVLRQQGFDEGRAIEAARGTAQGIDFEDVVEEHLREWAAGTGGCAVERTARTPGTLGPSATVGDFVVTLADKTRIVVEAKNKAALTLAGESGILAELDRAMANREAQAAVCISSRPTFPAEVGPFGVYGGRVLAVDDGEGTLLTVAMRWAAAATATGSAAPEGTVDTALLDDRLERIRKLAETFRTARRTLTEVRKSVDGVHETLGEMRRDLLDLVDDVGRGLRTAG